MAKSVAHAEPLSSADADAAHALNEGRSLKPSTASPLIPTRRSIPVQIPIALGHPNFLHLRRREPQNMTVNHDNAPGAGTLEK